MFLEKWPSTGLYMLKGHLLMQISLDLLSVGHMAMPNRYPVCAHRQCILNPPLHTWCVFDVNVIFYISGLAA